MTKTDKTNIFLVCLRLKNVCILLANQPAVRETWEVPMPDVIFGCAVLSSDSWSLPFLRTIRRQPTSVLPEDNRTRMLLSSCVRTVMLSTPSHAALSSPNLPTISSGSYYNTSEEFLTVCVHSPDNEELAHIQRWTQSKYWAFIDLT